MNTLTLVFNKARNHVLMFYDKKIEAYNYVGGKVGYMEDVMEASYRKLFEETGIDKNLIDLKFVRSESVSATTKHSCGTAWSMLVTAGILKESDIMFKGNKDSLVWIDIKSIETLINRSVGNGSCYTYLLEALDVLESD